MNTRNVLFFLFSLIATTSMYVDALSTNSTKKSFCFNFSWIGPKYTNESTFDNATCDDVTNMANNVPCRMPLVVTYDGSFPDLQYIRDNHFEDTTCLLTDGEVCASYTHLFNGAILNVTYMCTAVIDQNEGSITSGCHKQKSGSREINLCVCRSHPGNDVMPCNSAFSNSIPFLFLILPFILLTNRNILETPAL